MVRGSAKVCHLFRPSEFAGLGLSVTTMFFSSGLPRRKRCSVRLLSRRRAWTQTTGKSCSAITTSSSRKTSPATWARANVSASRSTTTMAPRRTEVVDGVTNGSARHYYLSNPTPFVFVFVFITEQKHVGMQHKRSICVTSVCSGGKLLFFFSCVYVWVLVFLGCI